MRSRRPMTRRRTPCGGAAFGFGAEIFFEQDEQRGDFAERAAPIIGGEGVERERADAEAGGGADDAADGFYSGAMAFGTNQAASGGPASIAIEEDGDVEFSLAIAFAEPSSKYFCS